MSCQQCQGIETEFDPKYAARELKKYRRKGPSKTTAMLIGALHDAGIAGATLLDIGGGVGAIQHALLAEGARNAVSVDASSAFVETAREEARRRGYEEQIDFQHGDFVDLAEELPSADIVTLDKVICCYDDMEELVRLSAGRAQRLYGAVYPRDVWWVKAGFNALNAVLSLFRRHFRTFIHPTHRVERLLRERGFIEQKYIRYSGIWQVVVFGRPGDLDP